MNDLAQCKRDGHLDKISETDYRFKLGNVFASSFYYLCSKDRLRQVYDLFRTEHAFKIGEDAYFRLVVSETLVPEDFDFMYANLDVFSTFVFGGSNPWFAHSFRIARVVPRETLLQHFVGLQENLNVFLYSSVYNHITSRAYAITYEVDYTILREFCKRAFHRFNKGCMLYDRELWNINPMVQDFLLRSGIRFLEDAISLRDFLAVGGCAPQTNAVRRFVNGDGDHAIGARVLGFLARFPP